MSRTYIIGKFVWLFEANLDYIDFRKVETKAKPLKEFFLFSISPFIFDKAFL